MNENGISRAEQRVREMNRMAQQYVRQGNNFMNSQSPGRQPQNMQQPQHQQPRFEPVHMQQNIPQNMQKNMSRGMQQSMPKPPAQELPRPVMQSGMQSFGMDTEKLLILLIMYLLIKEKADIKLIAALGYLLL